MSQIKFILNLSSGIIGIIAAVFWFISATHTSPPSFGAAYYDVGSREMEPLAKKWAFAGRLNALAAAATAFSVMLSAIAQLLPNHW